MSQSKPLSLLDFVAAARAQVKEVAPTDVERLRSSKPDLLIVDVREPGEHEQGYIEGAILVPRGILEAAADLNYPKHVEALYTAREKPVLLYCATGGRSAMGAVALQQMGFKEVYSLAGGIGQWQQAGLPLVSEARYV